MKPRRSTFARRRAASRAFTLIELIGVLAIIAIMASVLAPNMLRSLDRAAVRAEYETARQLGSQVELHLRDRGALPAAGTWTADIAAYSDLAAIDIQRNKRLNNRLLVYDTSSTPFPRALLLSSMRAGLNLPNAATVSANFQTIWQTADEAVPSTLNWAGWNAVANSGDYLVIERMNFRPIYLEELQTFTVTLNNTSGSGGNGNGNNGNSGNGNNGNGNGNSGNNGNGNSGTGNPATTASYRIVYANGTNAAAANLAAGASITLTGLHAGDRIDLYAASGGTNLNYSYVVSSTGRTIDFDGTQWMPN